MNDQIRLEACVLARISAGVRHDSRRADVIVAETMYVPVHPKGRLEFPDQPGEIGAISGAQRVRDQVRWQGLGRRRVVGRPGFASSNSR